MSLSCSEALQLLGFPSSLQGSLPPADAIRRAFRQQALIWHPDKHRGPPGGADSRPAAPSEILAGSGDGDREGPAPRNHGPAQAAEHFKRVAAAYHTLLRHAAAGASGRLGDVAGGGEGGGGGEEEEEEQLLDELSVELVLLEAQKLRLSDFDLVFLHQRASGGGGNAAFAAPSVWPEAAQSVDDVWRRIRRRVERRRRRREGGACGGSPPAAFAISGSGQPRVGAKWTLLSEFLADVVGATAPPPHEGPDHEPERPGTPPCRTNGGPAARGTEPVDGASGHAGCSLRQQDQEQQALAAQHGPGSMVGGDIGRVLATAPSPQLPAPRRTRGRLPPGFYGRWLKRLAVARLLFFVFFKS